MSTIAMSITRSKISKRKLYTAPLRNPALVAIYRAEGREATAADIGISAAYALVLQAQGLIEQRGNAKTGKPGRPPVIWGLTKVGQDRARRSIKK